MTYSNSDFIRLANEYIHSDRDRKIIIDRYVKGYTFAELESMHHLSERQIKRIVKKADVIFIKCKDLL